MSQNIYIHILSDISNIIIGDSVQDSYEEQEFWMTRLDWVGIRHNKFEMFEEHENCLSRWKQCGFNFVTVLNENHV